MSAVDPTVVGLDGRAGLKRGEERSGENWAADCGTRSCRTAECYIDSRRELQSGIQCVILPRCRSLTHVELDLRRVARSMWPPSMMSVLRSALQALECSGWAAGLIFPRVLRSQTGSVDQKPLRPAVGASLPISAVASADASRRHPWLGGIGLHRA